MDASTRFFMDPRVKPEDDEGVVWFYCANTIDPIEKNEMRESQSVRMNHPTQLRERPRCERYDRQLK